MSTIIINTDTAKSLVTTMIDECDMALDWINKTDNVCIQFFNEELWNSYGAFYQDIADLFFYEHIQPKVVEYIDDWVKVFEELYIAAGDANKRDLALVFTEDFWNDVHNLCHLVNANLYGIEKRRATA